jgi:hypothetical protein
MVCCALVAGGLGFRLVNVVLMQASTGLLRVSGQLTVSVIQVRLADFASYALYAARWEALAKVLTGGDPTLAATELNDMARLHGMMAVSLVDAAGQPVKVFNDRLIWTVLSDWDAPLTADPAVQQAVRRQLARVTAEPAAESGLIQYRDSPLFFAVGRVVADNHTLGALVLGISLSRALQGITGPLHTPLVIYDVHGTPLFSTFPESAADPAGLPPLPESLIGSGANPGQTTFEATLSRQC